MAGPLRDLLPEDHILRQEDRVLDLSWLRDEVKETYNEHLGRPSIDPDALHVALAAASGCRAIVRWNFRHIVHFEKIPFRSLVIGPH